MLLMFLINWYHAQILSEGSQRYLRPFILPRNVLRIGCVLLINRDFLDSSQPNTYTFKR